MDFLDTPTLVEAVKNIVPATSFLRDRYFPTNDLKDIFTTNDVAIEYRDGNRMAAPFVAPRKGGVTMHRNGHEVDRITPPRIAPSRALSIDNLKTRGYGEPLMGGVTPEKRQKLMLLDDAADLGDMITRREEVMAAEIMQNNSCVMKHIADDATAADEMEIKYYSGVSNPAKYTPTGNWTKEYQGITKDLRVMSSLLKKNGLGATDLIVGADVADAILNNSEIQKLLDLRNFNIGRVDPKELPSGATLIASLNISGVILDVICYEEQYTDIDGKDKAYIDPKNIVMTAPGAGKTCYGAVTQLEQLDGEYHTYPARRVPKYLSNAESNTRSITVTSCPVLMPLAKNPFIVAKVLS